MKGIKLLVIAGNVLINLTLLAQSPQPQKFLPVLAPSSPEAAAFKKYGNYDVNLFSGIPDISIPLYEIKIGELSIPINISYHSSGIKVNDIASRIGLGWDLHAGGSITRKIMGKADELPGNYLSATATSGNRVKLGSEIDPTTQDGLDYLRSVDQGYYDTEPDIFSYSFPGHNGKFLFNQKNNFTPVLIPYAPVSIAMSQPTASTLSLGMTDENGIVYKFDSTEWTMSGGGMTTSCTSSWLLSDMISSNKQDSVHFRYLTKGNTGMTDSYFSDYLVFDDNCTGSYTPSTMGQFNTDIGSVATMWKQMTEIDFRNGKIVFEAGPETREDFSGQYKLQNRLKAIKVYRFDPVNNIYIVNKSISFFNSYFISGTDIATKRLRLDSIQVQTGSGDIAQTYRFNYNTAVALPSNASRMKDYWGYFNNINNLDGYGNPTMVAKMLITTTSPYNGQSQIWIGGDHTNARDPDPILMQADVLQKITYPTGGFTQFGYETNRYLDAQGVAHYAGGLRIKSIKSYTDGTAVPLVKTYTYGVGESGFGRNNFLLEDHFFVSSQNLRKAQDMTPDGQCMGPNTKTTTTYFANPTNDLEGYDGAPVVYSFVTEYIGDSTTNAGKTTYTFSDITDARTSMIGYGKPILTSYHYVRGLLINQSDYRKNTDNTYSLVKENRKKYQYFPFQNTSGGLALGVFKRTIYEGISDTPSYITGCETGSCSLFYVYNNYEIMTGDNKLVTDTVINYHQNDLTKFNSVFTSFNYDDVTHLQLLTKKTVNSKNEPLVSSYTYPYNYTSAPYFSMTANHIYNKIITDTKTNSGSPLTVQSTNYSSFSGNNFLPGNVQLTIKANAPETRAFFNQYDLRGNILEMQKAADSKQSFIWDYQGLQPVAEVVNAGQTDIAYTSFEADGTGNWNFTGSSMQDPTAPTGGRCYTIGGGITKSGLNASGTYVVSYWKKSGTVAVNATSPITGRSLNGWTYYEHQVQNPTNGLITVSGNGAVIDELRLYPLGALMTTYCYTPLVGLTCKTDANNHISYYEYDQLNRPILIRNQDKNIVKQFCYNYAGLPENCAIVYNAVQSGSFSKTGCTSCQTGSFVTYQVAAQTYSAPTQTQADQLAMADVIANGQAYANSTGSCIAPSSAALTGSNAFSQSYSMQLTNNCSGTVYNFTLNSNASNTAMGSVPAGVYSVYFLPPSGSDIYTYRINSSYTLRANSGTISNVNLSSSGNTINITP